MILVVFIVSRTDEAALAAIKAVTGWDHTRHYREQLFRVENFFPRFDCWGMMMCPFVQEDLAIHVIGFGGRGPDPIIESRMPVNAVIKLSSGQPLPYDSWWEGSVFLGSYKIGAIELAAKDLTSESLYGLQKRRARRPDDTFVRHRQNAKILEDRAKTLRVHQEYAEIWDRIRAANKPTVQEILVRQNERLIEEVRDLRSEISHHRYD